MKASERMLMPERRLGLALRRWRVLNRVNQSHVAELFGGDQSTVSRRESGVQNPGDICLT